MPRSKRREFLRNSALAGLLAPVAMYWRDLPEARALDDRTNLVLTFLPNGTVAGNPFLNAGERPSFANGFRPYNEFADDVIAFREYGTQRFINRSYDGDHPGHRAPSVVMFTGDIPVTENGRARQAKAPSIDQIIAWDYLERGVINNPLRKSMHVRLGQSSHGVLPELFFTTPPDYSLGRTYESERVPVVSHRQPRDGFDQMFGDVAETGSGTSIDELRAFGQSILDIPAADLNAIRDQLPREGEHILDEHLQGLRDLERSFESGEIPDGAELPTRPGEMSEQPFAYEDVFEEWVKIIDAALRLDRTRIVTIQFGGVASNFRIPSLGLGEVGAEGNGNTGSGHHSYTHFRADDVPLFMNWYAERISTLLSAMKGDGSRANLLDCSALMVGMEFGRNHNAVDTPVTLFGSCGGYFDSGKVVTHGNEFEDYWMHTGTLLSLAHAMGVTDLERVGVNDERHHNGVPSWLRAAR